MIIFELGKDKKMMIFELGKDKKMIILETLKIKKMMIFAERGDDFLIILRKPKG